MIKSGIAKSFNIEDNLKDKKDNIMSTVGEIKLPQIEEYQSNLQFKLELIAKFLNAKKLVQMTSEGNKVINYNYFREIKTIKIQEKKRKSSRRTRIQITISYQRLRRSKESLIPTLMIIAEEN